MPWIIFISAGQKVAKVPPIHILNKVIWRQADSPLFAFDISIRSKTGCSNFWAYKILASQKQEMEIQKLRPRVPASTDLAKHHLL